MPKLRVLLTAVAHCRFEEVCVIPHSQDVSDISLRRKREVWLRRTNIVGADERSGAEQVFIAQAKAVLMLIIIDVRLMVRRPFQPQDRVTR